MKPGQVIEKFLVSGKEGKKIVVVFRIPRASDAKKLLAFINRARDQAKFLGQRKHETLASEKKFLKDRLKKVKENKEILLVAESGGKIIGDSDISPNKLETMNHTGEFGIALLEEFTGFGIGTRFGKCVISLAKKQKTFKIITSAFFSGNIRSRKLHKKLGFKKHGELPNGCRLRSSGYDNKVLVYKTIGKIK